MTLLSRVARTNPLIGIPFFFLQIKKTWKQRVIVGFFYIEAQILLVATLARFEPFVAMFATPPGCWSAETSSMSSRATYYHSVIFIVK